jgi:hypothetical protein
MGIGLRCWECGLYIDNYRTGHYCSRCLVKNIKKYMKSAYQQPIDEDTGSKGEDVDEYDESEDDYVEDS